MNIAEQGILNSARKAFIEDLKPKYIIPYLIEESIITEQEGKEIIFLESPEQQVEKLLDILPQKSSEMFKKFIEVLKGEDECGVHYPWLADKLITTTCVDLNGEIRSDVHNTVKIILRNGGVPFQTNCFLSRENKIENIRNKLCCASDKMKTRGIRHWVVLHGMTGTGKSVLAIETLKDNNLIERCFPDGVFWIPIGNLKDTNALGLKMKKLFKLLNCQEKYVPSFEELLELTDELKKIVVSKNLLVILDDVWDQDKFNVIKYFDIGCPILVTTKFPGVFDQYSDFCSLIQCTNDFLPEESKKLLALYVKCDSNVLPREVDWICTKCKGSPFTLSHIGRWMVPYGNDIKRWQSLKNKLDGGLQKAIRSRHKSGDELIEIKEIIHLTLEPISNYTDYFLDFVIFPEDVGVPSKVFEVLWSQDTFEVQDTMNCLVQKSLVQCNKDALNIYSYSIHDLYLEILKEICSNIQERHQRLVNNYLKFCKTTDGNYDFSLLPNDEYIHYYIGYHIDQAAGAEIVDGITLDDIYFDLKFIETKIRLDHRDLLVDYQNYRYLFKDKEMLEVFKAFASKVISKKITVSNKEDCDIVQWGLFEPADSIVYKKALIFALKSSNKSYFEWCNQEENQSHMTNLNSKLIPYQNMKHAAISADGHLVACVGNGNRIQIFSTVTGEELVELSGHSDVVNYCTFNSSRARLATCSDDRSVRIFVIDIPLNAFDMKPAKKRSSQPDINSAYYVSKSPDMSVVTFQQHFSKVLCCNFSPDDKLVVSSDVTGCIKIWQASTSYLKFSINHNAGIAVHPVILCQFNTDGTLVGTTAYDSVKLWFTENGTFFKEYLHSEIAVSGFCITQNHVITVANNNIHKHCLKTDEQNIITLSRNVVITSCSLSYSGHYLACGTSESTINIYNINSGKKISNLKGHKKDVLCVMYTKDSKKLLSVSEDGYIVHNIADVRDVSHVSFEGNLSVQQKSDDLIIACSNSFNCIEIRKGVSGHLYCKTKPDDSDITACSLSNDCKEVVYGTKSGSVKVFNIQNKVLDRLESHSEQINYITHSKNDLFFTCSEDKTIRLWESRKPLVVLQGHTKSVLMCVPFKKSNKLLSCSKDGTLRIWNIEKGEMILYTEGHGNQDVRFCDISFDETLMASASADKTVKIWYTENGTLYKTLECDSEVRCCRFSPLFRVLICGCDSGKVQNWQLGTRAELKASYDQQSDVFNVYFSEDGSQYISIADDIKISQTDKDDPQTLLLPSSYMGIARPSIWASNDFNIFVVIHDSVLYILKKIITSNGVFHH